MTRILIITLMLSFFGLGRSQAQENESAEEHKGVIGRYYENDLPVIVKFVNELPTKKIMAKLPFLTVVGWKYDGSEKNGMPPTRINEKMIVLERALESSMEQSDVFTHVYSRTGNNLKELVYYTTKQDDFMTMLNKALWGHEVYPIEINFYKDSEWSDFKKLMDRFEKN